MEYRLSMGPRIVAIGGGTGLSTLLGGLKGFTRNITAVVAVTDEGGSSGRLRQEWGMLPPGDIRNCIVALAENDSSLNSLLNFRFDRGELKGHSLGNLILLATTEMMGDFQRAVEELNRLLAAANSPEGSLNRFLSDGALYDSLTQASSNLSALLRDVKENPQRYVHISVFGGNKNKK